MPFPHLGAFESINIHGSGHDVLSTTGHIHFWQDDLDLLHGAGIQELRYPVPWHRIERSPNVFDWSWIDGPLKRMRDLGLRPILDPLHHVSVPDWLSDGFANPAFPDLYLRFIIEVAKRYEWVERYTIVNEPLPTLVLCALSGEWYPHRKSAADFVGMAKNVARVICRAAAELGKLNPGISFYHVDSCERHIALDAESEAWAAHANERRFLFHDLLLGRLGKHHPLLPYLTAHGFTEDDRQWYADHSGGIDILGLDYYAHSEIAWRWDSAEGRAVMDFPCNQPIGFAALAQHYVDRMKKPVMLSETNVGGSVTDRLTWLKCMESEAEKLAAVADFRGFCWFPSIDATDWNTLCTVAGKCLSPIGIWSLDETCTERSASELSHWYARLARGECSSRDLPAYRLMPPLDVDLAAYVRLMQPGVTLRDPADSEFEADAKALALSVALR